MGIDLMSGFGRVQPYYRASEIPTVTPDEVKKQDEQQGINLPSATESPKEQLQDNRSKTADLENVSLTFNKEESFDYLGRESELMKLDMQKAISDMKKDSVLQDYQYFVGSAASFMNTEDGLVFQK